MKVKWKKREDGNEPKPTFFTPYDLRFLDPFLLINYYESRLKFKKHSPKSSNLNSK